MIKSREDIVIVMESGFAAAYYFDLLYSIIISDMRIFVKISTSSVEFIKVNEDVLLRTSSR